MKENVVLDKSLEFAVRIVKLGQYLNGEKKEYVLSKQILRSGTSIGANVTEANDAISKADFLNKIYIALKECAETLYWLQLLVRTDYLTQEQYDSMYTDGLELKRLLTSIAKSTRDSIKEGKSHD